MYVWVLQFLGKETTQNSIFFVLFVIDRTCQGNK